ncbi:MAG: sterol desaturase family protein [Bacteroidota bacterium]|nr:sterol desaturase family protein [Candidatus Kapabacteria bacterium]MDW8271972.1 sterol desaturase family protein [Bacteroidota bacterium]
MPLYVSNKDETVRLFKNPVLEYFSHIHPATPVVVYVPVVIWMIYRAAYIVPWYSIVGSAIAGVVAWTLFEYIFHRFVFHYEPKSEWGKRLHFLVHGVHHDYPRDRTRLVMPLLVSVPLAIALYLAFGIVLPAGWHEAFFGGFVAGYVAYDSIHYMTHHWQMPGRIGRFLKAYHMKHHYVNPQSAFGVSNPLWDYVFGTVPSNKHISRNPTHA